MLASFFLVPILGLLLVLLLVLFLGCGRPPQASSEPPTPSLTVEYAGCEGARRDRICILPADGTLTLWIAEPADGFSVAVDEQPVTLPTEDIRAGIQGGTRIALALPPGTRTVTVRRYAPKAIWTLRTEPDQPAPWLARVIDLLRQRDREGAASALAAVVATPPGDHLRARHRAHAEGHHGRALGLLGQIALRRGDLTEGRRLLRESLTYLGRSGDLLQSFDQTTALVHALAVIDNQFSEARSLLENLPRDWDYPGEVAYFDAYYRGIVDLTTGNVRGALEHLETAVAVAERTGTLVYRQIAEEMVAVQLQRIGRHQEAAEILSSLHDEAASAKDACRQAGLLNNLGWNALLAYEAGHPGASATEQLRQAAAMFEHVCTNNVPERQNVLINLALAELATGDLPTARETLERANDLPTERGLRVHLWWLEIEGRMALAEGDLESASSAYESLAKMADTALVPDAVWRAQVGLAIARWRAGDHQGARAAFASSERQLAAELPLVPLQAGREIFLTHRESATAQHLALLLELGEHEEALALARRARQRLLRHLNRSLRFHRLSASQRVLWDRFVADYQQEQARITRLAGEDWQLAQQALSQARADRVGQRDALAARLDEVLASLGTEISAPGPLRVPDTALALVFHPLPKGWAVFARYAARTRVITPSCGQRDPRALAACLLQPLAAEIREASEIRLLPAGVLARLDFQTVPFDGDVLLRQAPIVYDLDLGRRDRGTRQEAETAATPRTAVIVADPTGDLPAARQEARSVARLLAERTTTTSLAEREASVEAFHRALPGADLLHIAGHASYAGRGGWQTFMPLAARGRLGVEDVLLLEQPPEWVVLSGCETARAEHGQTVAEGIGLAQAFLLAGSRAVVAAVRPVDDRLARELVEALYPAWLGGLPLSQALQEAQLALHDARPDADWASFRLMER